MRVQLVVVVDVIDEAKLREYAARRYRECWLGELEPDGDIEVFVREALLSSCEGPEFADMGVELARIDAALIEP